MNRNRLLSSIGVVACLAHVSLPAADWPQYRGPNHDGVSPEQILQRWPETGPKTFWKVPLTDGFSSVTVGSGKAFTLVARMIEGTRQEVCLALDASSGNELWATPLGVAKYDGGGDSGTSENKGGDGPRSTPSVDGERVYTFSSRLVLQCLKATDGKPVWSKDLIKEYDGRNIGWQNAASPLIDGKLVFVAGCGAGQSLLAFDKQDGHVVWKGQDEKTTHATPVVATIHGVRQVIYFVQSGLISVQADSGAVLWRHPFRYSVSTAASPVVAGDLVYCSAGYGVGASVCKIAQDSTGFKATQVWFRPAKEINSHWSTPVFHDGYLYGLFGFKEYGKAPLKCIEMATGKEMWSKDGFGPGGCLAADGHVIVLSDAGDLVLVKAAPAAYAEVTRARVLSGKCWSSPGLADGRLYVRSTKEGACLDLAP